MASAITMFMDLARTHRTQGVPILEVFGPSRPAVDLLFRKRLPSAGHSICHFAFEHVAGVKGLSMPEKLGMTFMYIYLLRVSHHHLFTLSSLL
jgi:hypothetical protein